MKKLKEWFKNRSVNQMAWIYSVFILCLLVAYIFAIFREPAIFFITCLVMIVGLILFSIHRGVRQVLVKRERKARR